MVPQVIYIIYKYIDQIEKEFNEIRTSTNI